MKSCRSSLVIPIPHQIPCHYHRLFYIHILELTVFAVVLAQRISDTDGQSLRNQGVLVEFLLDFFNAENHIEQTVCSNVRTCLLRMDDALDVTATPAQLVLNRKTYVR